MTKILKQYRIIFGSLIFIVCLFLSLNLILKVKLDRLMFINKTILNERYEFKQAMENRFVKLKDDLLSRDIVLDNIFIDGDKIVKFDIHKTMYSDQIIDLIMFLNNIDYLNINEINIIRNDLSYDVAVFVEI